MKLIRNQSIYNALITYSGVVFGYLNMVLLYPRFLSVEQLGLLTTILAVSMIAMQLAKLGAPYFIVRFFSNFQGDDASRRRFFSFLIGLTIVGISLFTTLYLLLQPTIIQYYGTNSPLFVSYNMLVIPMVILMTVFELLFNICRVLMRSVLPTFRREIVVKLINLAAILLYMKGFVSFNTFVWMYILAYGIPNLIVGFSLLRDSAVEFSKSPILAGYGREFLQYGSFVTLTSIATVMNTEIDKLMISSLKGLGPTGVYSIAAFFALIIQIPGRAVITVAAPMVTHYINSGEIDKVASIYKKSSVNQLIVGVLLFVLICTNLHNIFALLPPAFEAGKYVIVFLGIARLFDLATGVNTEIIVHSKHYKYDLYLNICLVVLTVVFNLIFIRLYGITGAAIGSAISMAAYNVAKSCVVWLKFGIHPLTNKTPLIFVAGAVAFVVGYFVPYVKNLYFDTPIRSLPTVIVFCGLVYLLKISPDINDLLDKKILKRT